MEWVKTTAKTLPEAIDLALDNLGVDESEAEIVILEEPRTGLFGRTRGTARVEARVKPKPIRPKNERGRNRRNRPDDGRGGRNRNRNRKGGGQNKDGRGGDNRNRNDGQSKDGDQRRDGGRGRNQGQGQGGQGGQGQGGGRKRNRRSGQGGGQNRDQNQNQNRDRSDVDETAGGRGNGGGRGRGRGNGGDRSGSKSEKQQERTSSSSNGEKAQPSEGATVEEVATHLQTFLTDLTEAFGFDSSVKIDDSEEGTLVGTIDGRHGLLVGPKGRTLDAVQELARISCQRTAPSGVRIKVDVGGYREQRAAALAEFASKAADRASAEGAEVALEPMSPADRKSVHDALNGDDRVETRSVGAEPRRRVVVVPLESSAGDGLSEVEDDDTSAGDEEE